MTKAEHRKLQRLEIENAELRRANGRHIQVYGEMIGELIALRTQREFVNQMLTETLDEICQ